MAKVNTLSLVQAELIGEDLLDGKISRGDAVRQWMLHGYERDKAEELADIALGEKVG